MDFELIPLREADTKQFKKNMREAFQLGAEEGGEPSDREVLPESHIDRSMNTKGAIAYEALVDGELAGGVIVVIDEVTQRNHLDFLFVKYGTQSKGVGQRTWKTIEERHPDTKIWETYTPYFEKRNIHFYINRCGFHAVEFFNKHHPDPNDPNFENDYVDEGFGDMFRLEKEMK